MHERLKASEVGQIECQTCEKKNLCSKKNFRENFFERTNTHLLEANFQNKSN